MMYSYIINDIWGLNFLKKKICGNFFIRYLDIPIS